MASTSSLLNFLSPLFPSTTITTTTNTPKFPPQTNSSSTLLSITPSSSSQTQQQIKPISAKNDELLYQQGEVMAVVCPSLAYSNTLFFNSSYNVQVLVDDNEPEERLLNRFRREVMRAGVIQECKRRRHFENKQDKEKRKSREAAKRNSRRRRGPPPRFQNRDEPTKVEKKEDDGDNWEMPQGDSPF
ncbi:small ribosomal subunit protein bS21c-like [Silene latifolia]|uniref:small ribosomal subunit protein bS21c-like n=1 Tax=Silene latifolia TaxID=37657 RepID=UPI003D78AA4C